MMTDHVFLSWKRNRGWPWPESSFGLTPMFGEGGWCHSCGVPRRPQAGPLVLERKGMTVRGAWVPNWNFDAICVEQSVALEVSCRFDVETRAVDWHPSSPGDAAQIVVPTIGTSWFDEAELRDAAVACHGVDGVTCE